MPLTWVDIFLIGVLFYFAFKGWTQGVVYLAASLLAFAVSLYLALSYSSAVSTFLTNTFGLTNRLAGLVAYFMIAFAAEAVLSEILSRLLVTSPESASVTSKKKQVVGAFVSATSGLFLVSVFLFIVLLVPIRGSVKQDIRSSLFAPVVLSFIERYGGPLPEMLTNSAKELTQFMTIDPNSTERVFLDVSVQEKNLHIDQVSEDEMFELINAQRQKEGVAPLRLTLNLQYVARDYSTRMLLERFFSHIDPNGNDAADRLAESGVKFFLAGENLAYAPNVTTAHEGLMKSEGHRRNILDPKFHRVGIGVIDAGIWGRMFTQVFAD